MMQLQQPAPEEAGAAPSNEPAVDPAQASITSPECQSFRDRQAAQSGTETPAADPEPLTQAAAEAQVPEVKVSSEAQVIDDLVAARSERVSALSEADTQRDEGLARIAKAIRDFFGGETMQSLAEELSGTLNERGHKMLSGVVLSERRLDPERDPGMRPGGYEYRVNIVLGPNGVETHINRRKTLSQLHMLFDSEQFSPGIDDVGMGLFRNLLNAHFEKLLKAGTEIAPGEADRFIEGLLVGDIGAKLAKKFMPRLEQTKERLNTELACYEKHATYFEPLAQQYSFAQKTAWNPAAPDQKLLPAATGTEQGWEALRFLLSEISVLRHNVRDAHTRAKAADSETRKEALSFLHNQECGNPKLAALAKWLGTKSNGVQPGLQTGLQGELLLGGRGPIELVSGIIDGTEFVRIGSFKIAVLLGVQEKEGRYEPQLLVGCRRMFGHVPFEYEIFPLFDAKGAPHPLAKALVNATVEGRAKKNQWAPFNSAENVCPPCFATAFEAASTAAWQQVRSAEVEGELEDNLSETRRARKESEFFRAEKEIEDEPQES